MPQMSPMNWCFLFFFFLLIIMLIMNFIYFFFISFPSINLLKNHSNFYQSNWLW
uniref:ATP synthase F0 subunit 8 n=1 Tax=Tryella crassa TaxID=1218666 RepID=A0A3S7MEN2_9HEMI|nr:ATP synthase F0 subunit 8 [Tryella crassa]